MPSPCLCQSHGVSLRFDLQSQQGPLVREQGASETSASGQAASLLGDSELNSVVGNLGARAETWAWRYRML